MRYFKRKLMAVITILVILATSVLPVFAAEDTLTILLKTGSDTMSVNGTSIKVEKPYYMDNSVYLPLNPVFEAFGGEILTKEDKTVELIYRDISLELKAGVNTYYSNQTKKELKSVVRQGSEGLMIPLELIDNNFNVKIEYNSATGNIKIVMEDDGALTDLSFLTDSISKSKVGNSYFNWSINVPSGSRVYDASYNSKYICIDNEDRQLAIEVDITPAEGKKLEDYYDEVQNNTEYYFGNEPDETSLNNKANPAYAQFLYTSAADEAAVRRSYIFNDKVYNVTLTNYTETNPYTITDSAYLMGLLDSFRLDYKGQNQLVQDMSKVEFGMVKYQNNISFDKQTYYKLWEINSLPDWDLIDQDYSNILNTTLGPDKKEYINVNITDAGNETDISKYGRNMLTGYSKYLSSDLYKLTSAKASRLNEYKSYNMKYDLTFGQHKYKMDENFILANGLIYDITVKIPEDSYNEDSVIFENLMSSFKINNLDINKFKNDLKYYNSKFGSQRISTADKTTVYQNKIYDWKISLPGYWKKAATIDDSVQIFTHPFMDLQLGIESVPALEDTTDESFEDQFMLLGSLMKYYNFEKTDDKNIKVKGMNVREITYKIGDDKEQMFGEVKCRLFTKGDYTYTYIAIIDDLCSTQAAQDEMANIWNSFAFVD